MDDLRRPCSARLHRHAGRSAHRQHARPGQPLPGARLRRKPRPDFPVDQTGDMRNVIDVLKEDGVRFGANGAAHPPQLITAAELSSLIEVLDDDAIEASDGPPTELVGQQEWRWDRYAELGIRDERLAIGRELV